MSTIADIFSLSGPLASAMPAYTLREAQLEMAEAVSEVIQKDGVLLAEAGTGTGKTLAYLVPTVLSELSAVISTGTKNLQEQVFFKDIAFLEEALGITIDAVYLKGQDNYLCKRRMEEFLRSPAVLAHAPAKVAALKAWALQTETGDRMEMADLRDDDPIFREVCSTRETRIGAKCRHFEACFVTCARQRAMQARIVVVNHHLYFADVTTRQKGGSLLPSHDVLILDEAHAIEDVATEFFSKVKCDYPAVMFLLGDQPMLNTATINVLLERFWADEKDICVPIYQGKRKTPAIFKRRFYTQLMGIKGDMGARQLINDNPDRVLGVEMENPICFFDVDTRQDFERLKKNLIKAI